MPSIARQISTWTGNDIRSLFKKARFICRHPSLDVRAAPTDKEIGRIIVITPKKMGNAVKRNKIRRQLKSLFYTHQLYTKGHDWLFFAKPGITTCSYQDLYTFIIEKCVPSLSTDA